jgi:multimeric flavodoxin WrbA
LVRILAIRGSPRRQGNTSSLLQEAVKGAREAGADVEEVVLRDLQMSPCLEIYGCKRDGRCVIEDDFQGVYDQLLSCNGLILASPIFFIASAPIQRSLSIAANRCG